MGATVPYARGRRERKRNPERVHVALPRGAVRRLGAMYGRPSAWAGLRP
jgi:hypothetical protein